jgi:hypothetical protein
MALVRAMQTYEGPLAVRTDSAYVAKTCARLRQGPLPTRHRALWKWIQRYQHCLATVDWVKAHATPEELRRRGLNPQWAAGNEAADARANEGRQAHEEADGSPSPSVYADRYRLLQLVHRRMARVSQRLHAIWHPPERPYGPAPYRPPRQLVDHRHKHTLLVAPHGTYCLRCYRHTTCDERKQRTWWRMPCQPPSWARRAHRRGHRPGRDPAGWFCARCFAGKHDMGTRRCRGLLPGRRHHYALSGFPRQISRRLWASRGPLEIVRGRLWRGVRPGCPVAAHVPPHPLEQGLTPAHPPSD